MTIGDTRYFAVEYNFSPDHAKEMGFGKIWIENNFIGTSEDLIYLRGYLLKTLHHIQQAEAFPIGVNIDKVELFYILDNQLNWDYRIPSTTFIDDFSIFCFKNDSYTYFIWRLTRNTDFTDLIDYPKDIKLQKVETSYLNHIINNVRDEFKKQGI